MTVNSCSTVRRFTMAVLSWEIMSLACWHMSCAPISAQAAACPGALHRGHEARLLPASQRQLRYKDDVRRGEVNIGGQRGEETAIQFPSSPCFQPILFPQFGQNFILTSTLLPHAGHTAPLKSSLIFPPFIMLSKPMFSTSISRRIPNDFPSSFMSFLRFRSSLYFGISSFIISSLMAGIIPRTPIAATITPATGEKNALIITPNMAAATRYVITFQSALKINLSTIIPQLFHHTAAIALLQIVDLCLVAIQDILFDGFLFTIAMKALLSCEFNMDTDCIELKYSGGSIISINCSAVEEEVANSRFQRV